MRRAQYTWSLKPRTQLAPCGAPPHSPDSLVRNIFPLCEASGGWAKERHENPAWTTQGGFWPCIWPLLPLWLICSDSCMDTSQCAMRLFRFFGFDFRSKGDGKCTKIMDVLNIHHSKFDTIPSKLFNILQSSIHMPQSSNLLLLLQEVS